MTAASHLVAQATDHLLRTASRLPEGGQHEPSLCPGWTRGHVLTHIARNADGLVNLVTWATTGVPTPMYSPGDSREAEIEAGASRPVAELVADVEASARRLAEAAATLRPEHDAVDLHLRGGVLTRASALLDLRLREVTYHHVDLDAGFGFADLSPDLAARFLDGEVRRLRSTPGAPSLSVRTDEGDRFVIGDGAARVTGSRAAVLGWLARGLTEGVHTATLPDLPPGN